MEEHRILNGRYRIEELIGRGGMADVFRAVDLRLNRTVAVKLMRADLARDPQFQSRFRREARAAAALNHPSIVGVFDTGEVRQEDGQHHPVDCPFLVLEHVQGRTLREVLAEGGVSWRQAVEWTRGVLQALDHAHDLGIVHRDVKPANVMVTEDGEVKVMDFGIARALGDTSASTSQPQTVVGTALYLPPEQATGGEVDARSDLYAVGCLLFELLTGRPPFTGDTPLAVAYQHVRQDPPAPSDVDPSLPPAFDAVVLRALRKDPDGRYASGTEFLRALDAAAADPYAVAPADDDAPTAAVPVMGAGAGARPETAARPEPTARLEGLAEPASRTAPLPATSESPAVRTVTDPPTGGLAVVAGAGPGVSGHAVAGSSLPGAPSAAQLAAAASVERRGPITASRPVVPAAAAPAGASAVAVGAGRHRRPGRRLLLGLAAALAGLLALLGVLSLLLGALDRDAVKVPEVRGMPENQAVELVKGAGLRAVVEGVQDATASEGHVVGTDPGGGAGVGRGSTVRVRVARSGAGVLLPETLRGATEAAARAELTRLGLVVSSVEYHDTGGLARGQIVRTEPEVGTRVAAGSSVVLHLSSGMVRLPDLRGMTAADARLALEAVGKDLAPRFQSPAGEATVRGVVVSQSPEPDTRVDNRSSVTLVTSVDAVATAAPSDVVALDPVRPNDPSDGAAGGGAGSTGSGGTGSGGAGSGGTGRSTGGGTGGGTGTGTAPTTPAPAPTSAPAPQPSPSASPSGPTAAPTSEPVPTPPATPSPTPTPSVVPPSGPVPTLPVPSLDPPPST